MDPVDSGTQNVRRGHLPGHEEDLGHFLFINSGVGGLSEKEDLRVVAGNINFLE